METKFYKCPICGNVIIKLCDSSVAVHCCGTTMIELKPNTQENVEILSEKHLPAVECPDKCSVKVKVGSAPHPMAENHSIKFIYLQTESGGQIRKLSPSNNPEAVFWTCLDRPVVVYAYCDVHGLFKTSIKNTSNKC